MKHGLVFVCAALMPLCVHAAENVRRIPVYFGTGFVVSSEGHVITNNHVIRHCGNDIRLFGAVQNAPATIVATAPAQDLALLKTDAEAEGVARLRDTDQPLQPGEMAVTVGFPGGGPLTTREAQVISPTGPNREPQWVQFSDSVKQGNSGGPLLDSSASVIGVIMGKADIYALSNPPEGSTPVRKADIAISIPVLREFLEANHVRYRNTLSFGLMTAGTVESRARAYVVQVKCVGE